MFNLAKQLFTRDIYVLVYLYMYFPIHPAPSLYILMVTIEGAELGQTEKTL